VTDVDAATVRESLEQLRFADRLLTSTAAALRKVSRDSSKSTRNWKRYTAEDGMQVVESSERELYEAWGATCSALAALGRPQPAEPPGPGWRPNWLTALWDAFMWGTMARRVLTQAVGLRSNVRATFEQLRALIPDEDVAPLGGK